MTFFEAELYSPWVQRCIVSATPWRLLTSSSGRLPGLNHQPLPLARQKWWHSCACVGVSSDSALPNVCSELCLIRLLYRGGVTYLVMEPDMERKVILHLKLSTPGKITGGTRAWSGTSALQFWWWWLQMRCLCTLECRLNHDAWQQVGRQSAGTW